MARRVGFVLALLALFGAAIAQAQSTPTATYQIEFQATWSAATHPVDFPPNPHFSRLVGTTHDASVQLWGPGALATQGIQDMAERGGG